MSRKPINWTDERIAKAKEAISTNRAVSFRNEPGIVFDKETGWFLTNPYVVGVDYNDIRFDLIPDDMDFHEPDDADDYKYIALALPEEIFYIGLTDERYWAAGDGDECLWCNTSDFDITAWDDKTEHLDELQVVYVDKTYEDCGFKNTPVRERMQKVLDLFIKLNLYPYINGNDDNYELNEDGSEVANNKPVINMELVNKTANMLAPIIMSMGLNKDEKEELKKLIF